MATQVKQTRQNNSSRREGKLKIDARSGGGILVIGGVLIAAALGTAFAARRTRSSSDKGGRKTSSKEVDKEVNCSDDCRKELSVDTLVEVQEKAYKEAEDIIANDKSDDVVHELPFSGVELNKKNLEEFETGHIKDAEKEDEKESSTMESEEETERGENGSDGTDNSSLESNDDAVWPSEVIEQEKQLGQVELTKMKCRLDIRQEQFPDESWIGVQKNAWMTVETSNKQLDGDIDDGTDVAQEFSFWGIQSNMPPNETVFSLKESEIAHVEKGESDSMEPEEENVKSFVEEKGEKEESSKVIWASSMGLQILIPSDCIDQKPEQHIVDSSEEIQENSELIADILESQVEANIDDSTDVQGFSFNAVEFNNKKLEELESSCIKEEKVEEQQEVLEANTNNNEIFPELSFNGFEFNKEKMEKLDISHVKEKEKEEAEKKPLLMESSISEVGPQMEISRSTEELAAQNHLPSMNHQQGEGVIVSSINVKEEICRNVEIVTEVLENQSTSENIEMIVQTSDEQLEAKLDNGGLEFNKQNLEELEISHVKEREKEEQGENEGKKQEEGEEEIKQEVLLMELVAEEALPFDVNEKKVSVEVNEIEHQFNIPMRTEDMVVIAEAQNNKNMRMDIQNLFPSVIHQQEEVPVDCSVIVKEEISKNVEMDMKVLKNKDTGNYTEIIDETSDNHEEAEIDDGGVEFHTYYNNKNSIESEISEAEEEEGDLSIESEDEDIEFSIIEADERSEQGSEGSYMETNAEKIWPNEIIRSKKELLLTEDMIRKTDANVEAAVLLARGEKRTDIVPMAYSRACLLFLAFGLVLGFLAYGPRDHRLPQIYQQLCQLLFPAYNKALGEI